MAKKKRKAQLSYQQTLMVNIKAHSLKKEVNEDDRAKAKSLVKWFYANGYFTQAQVGLIKKLTYARKNKPKAKKHYLYAISNGEQVKLGMSSDVNKRLKALQTSSPSDLVLLWKYYIANTSADAIKIEKLLHRACKEFRIRGEWFTMDCIPIVNSFNPNKKHTAKWEMGKLISVDRKRKNGVLNFSVENIRRTNLTNNMSRVWEQKNTDELYQVEIQKMLGDGDVVLITYI